MTNFINTPNGKKLAYNHIEGNKVGIVFLSGFGSDMQGKKALFIEKWAKNNNHSFLRFDYSGHGLSSSNLRDTCFSDWYQDAEFIIKKLTKGKQLLIGSSMGGWIMLMLAKLLKKRVFGLIGLAAAPDFPKILIWEKMSNLQKRQLIADRGISFNNEDGSTNFFSYNLIKNSFQNLTLKEDINFTGPVYLYHGMQDKDVPYTVSIDIMSKIIGSSNINLLLDRNAGHRLSERNQLNNIIDIIKKIVKGN